MTILMNVLMTVYLIFIKNYCADCSNFNEIKDLISVPKLKITEMDLKFQNLHYKPMPLFIRD